jgi:oligoribonuclease
MTIAFLEQYVGKGKSPLCGNTIGQDRRFMVKYMPELEAYFHYRNVDVSSIKELVVRWQPDILSGFKKKNVHLALDDIRESIDELKFYREKVFSI